MNKLKLDEFLQLISIPHFARRKCGILCDVQQLEIFRRCTPRTILNCARQTGKSTAAALKAVHTAYWQCDSTIVITAPTLQQTREFIRKARNFAFLAGASLRGSKDAIEFKNGSRIVAVAANEDTVRGFSAVALLLIDEASRVKDEVYFALLPMLAVSDGSIWLLSTPKGKRGFFHAVWESTDPTEQALTGPAADGSVTPAPGSTSIWIKIRARAQDCPRISSEFLESQKRLLGERRFTQEYECAFIDISRGVFHPDSVRNAFTDDIKPLDF